MTNINRNKILVLAACCVQAGIAFYAEARGRVHGDDALTQAVAAGNGPQMQWISSGRHSGSSGGCFEFSSPAVQSAINAKSPKDLLASDKSCVAVKRKFELSDTKGKWLTIACGKNGSKKYEYYATREACENGKKAGWHK